MPDPASDPHDDSLERRRIRLRGTVQGVGVRPSIARLAHRAGVAGRVFNTGNGVEVVVEGTSLQLDQFVGSLRTLPGSVARIEALPARSKDRGPPLAGFQILPSLPGEVIDVDVPRDVAVCDECLQDVAGPGRRGGYALTTCAVCGPRYSLLRSLPFDRLQTGMAEFPLCARCQAEYSDPADRRFHAQTIGCPECGPRIWCSDRLGGRVADQDSAVTATVHALRSGLIVALCGLGGYQLLCDATASQAVTRLRARKRRASKPLAVLVAGIDEAEQLAELTPVARVALTGPANPIVVVPARTGNGLAAAVHPGLRDVGLMLPGSPLLWLLARAFGSPLILTSGNREGEPLVVEVGEAQTQLGEIADLFLHHDRPILHPVDDSVVRPMGGRVVTLRLARGLAPLRLQLEASREVVALGGHQKGAIALSNGRQVVLGPHVGDLEGLQTRERFVSHVRSLCSLYGVQSPRWVGDLHPGYFSTQWGREQSGDWVGIQHHHAHIAAGMLERGWLDREVLGIAWDGTGFGPGGTIWGGEFLRATRRGFVRVAHLRPFRLPGGDAAIREPWRIALALLAQALPPDALSTWSVGRWPETWRLLQPLVNAAGSSSGRGQLAPGTTSAGRLFDGFASLILGIQTADFEGAPAMWLEAVCDAAEEEHYPFELEPTSPVQIDWRPAVRAVVADVMRGISPAIQAMRLHRGLADVCRRLVGRFPDLGVVLGGGCFQNRCLTELLTVALEGEGREVGFPALIPPNDGGLAAGQLVVATSSDD